MDVENTQDIDESAAGDVRVSSFKLGKASKAFLEYSQASPLENPTEVARWLIGLGLAVSGYWSKSSDQQVVAGVLVPGGLTVATGQEAAVSSDSGMNE